MATMYCDLCQRPVEAKRAIGVGTLLLVLVTFGLWLLLIPFYTKRCPICKSDSLHEPEGKQETISAWLWVPAALIAIAYVISNMHSSPTSVKSAPAIAGEQPTAPPPVQPDAWIYSNSSDDLTGKPIKYAISPSLNTVDLHWPYGPGIRARLVLRRLRNQLNAFIELDKGQILCRSYEDCVLSVRFDEDSPVQLSAVGAADLSTETVFFRNASKFASRLKRAKHVIVELPMYQDGNRTWEFNVEGFKPI